MRNHTARIYSCHGISRNTLSRIDLSCSNASICTMIADIQYLPRAVSDHSPLLVLIGLPHMRSPHIQTRVHPFWLPLFDPGDQLEIFVDLHNYPMCPLTKPETFKAYLQGCLKYSISYVKRKSSLLENTMAEDLTRLEETFLTDSSEVNKMRWLQHSR